MQVIRTLAHFGVFCSTYPTIPIFSPPTSKTFDLTKSGGDLGQLGSKEIFKFETTTEKFTAFRKATRLSTPSSNS